jgi:L-fuculose-phosphate aldolase
MKMYIGDAEARELICAIGRKMYQKQFVAANDGNMTVRVADDAVIMTPTGVSKGDLTPEMLLKVDFAGNILEGTYKPTSEMPMHLRIYMENGGIQSTAHAHPVFLSCFANLGAELDLSITPSTAAISGRIPVAPYRNPGSSELADSVAPYVRDFNVVMLANHGPISWGRTPIEAWHILEESEHYARIALIQKYIVRRYRPISKPQIEELAITHDVVINPRRLVDAPLDTNNTEPAFSLAAMPVPSAVIDDETIRRIADAVAEKLSKA